MVRIELLSWEQAEPVAAPIRFAIFVEEQQADGIELDDVDSRSPRRACCRTDRSAAWRW
jgi:hypothetical protein